MLSLKSRLSLVALIAAVPAMAADRAAEIERLKPVAEKGEAAAQYQLGLLYAEGKDLPEAAHYYKLAAEQDGECAHRRRPYQHAGRNGSRMRRASAASRARNISCRQTSACASLRPGLSVEAL